MSNGTKRQQERAEHTPGPLGAVKLLTQWCVTHPEAFMDDTRRKTFNALDNLERRIREHGE
jgi:hypothetical protein